MIKLKTKEEIEILREGGSILAVILKELKNYCLENYKNGKLTTADINKKSDELMAQNNVLPAFPTAQFPTGLCISINNEVVHGVPGARVLKEGDIVGTDIGIIYKNLYTDSAISFILGNGSSKDKRLIETAEKALYKGIEQCKIGNTTGDIGFAIEKYVLNRGLDVVREYCGHGVGYSVHEEPAVPNHGPKDTGVKLVEGMVIAIEPMVVTGKGSVFIDSNGWTVKTRDGGRTAHFEHSVAITKDGPVVLTK